MKTAKLSNMIKGWFVGNFDPSLYKTDDVEVAIKLYKSGDYEEMHHHKIATEITVIVSGRVKMNKNEFASGDIIVVKPNEATDFLVIEDTATAVVKIPGAKDDKYRGVVK